MYIYISEVVYKAISNGKQTKQNKELHNYKTCQKSDFHTQYCRTNLYKSSYENAGIKLFNKLPDTIKRIKKPMGIQKATTALLNATCLLFSR